MPESFKLDRAAQLLESLLSNGYAKYIDPDLRRAMYVESQRLLCLAIDATENEPLV